MQRFTVENPSTIGLNSADVIFKDKCAGTFSVVDNHATKYNKLVAVFSSQRWAEWMAGKLNDFAEYPDWEGWSDDVRCICKDQLRILHKHKTYKL